MRADLVRVLRAEATRAGARILVDRRVSGDPDDPLTAGADLVVGADGIWSVTRRTLDPAAPVPRYAGLYSVSGTTDGPVRLPGERPQGFNMVFVRRGAFIYLPAPDGTVWWSAQVAAADPPQDLTAVGPAELTELFRTEKTPLAVLRASSRVTASTLLHVLPPR